MVRIVCDRCKSAYTAKQEMRSDRIYQVICKVCGNRIIIRPGRPAQAQTPSDLPAAEGPLAPGPIASAAAEPTPRPSFAPLPEPVPEPTPGIPAANPGMDALAAPLAPPSPQEPPFIDLFADEARQAQEPPPGPSPLPLEPRLPPPRRPAAPRQVVPTGPLFGGGGEPGSRKLGPVVGLAGLAIVLAGAALFFFLRGGGAPAAASAPVMQAPVTISTEPPPLAAPWPGAEPEAGRDRPRPPEPIPPEKASESTAERAVERIRSAEEPRPRRASQIAAAPPATATERPAASAPAAQVAPPPATEKPAAAEAAAAPAALAIEEAPAYPTTGFRKAAQEDPTCVQRSVRIPRNLAGLISGPVTVRFAVGPDGSVSLFQVHGDVPDKRIGDAIRAAVESCKFIPGTDPQGRPTRLWLVMPVRFVGQ